MQMLDGRAAIIPAAQMVTHHADCEYPFRQNSDFWYLTGLDEPDAIALFLPHKNENERFILFLHPKEPGAEVWNGFRWGVEGALAEFNADVAHPLADFPQLLNEYLKGAEGIVFRVGKHLKVEALVLEAWAKQLEQYQRIGSGALALEPPCLILHQLRLRKEPHEIERMREAARISAEAHVLAFQQTRVGMNEREIQALIEQYFLQSGTRGPAYGSIVAGGDNACVLHYTANNSILRDGDLLLIDAGCSLQDYYNGDVTRTYPINGSFTAEQRAIYELVLSAQKAAISSVVAGQNTESVHAAAVYRLVEGLLELGLLQGNIDQIIENQEYRHFYMHRTGHWLGLDVHDVGAYRLGEYPVELEVGMVLTVEPGLYISDRLPVPEGQPAIQEKWKGIGIRIEDDVLVSANGNEVLSAAAPTALSLLEK